MKYSYAGMGMIVLGLFGIIFIIMFQSITINNESEYYVLKEAMEAAMFESIDYAYFRNVNRAECVNNGCESGEVKISEQKFVENFTRRFVASISGDATKYTIEFYDIIEKPPKATVIVKAKTKEYQYGKNDTATSYEIVNNLTGILERYQQLRGLNR